jgi:thymidine kinase
MNKGGSIKVILGCMFSGKTTALIKEYYEWASIGKIPLCINYKGDNRYSNSNSMYSHDGKYIECIKTAKLGDIDKDLIDRSDIILINEGQFFPDLLQYCKLWCDEYGKIVTVCGLKGDYNREPFEQMSYLIPHAEEIENLHAYCKSCNDGTLAHFTHRKSDEKEKVLIGVDMYEPLCRKCLLKNQKK